MDFKKVALALFLLVVVGAGVLYWVSKSGSTLLAPAAERHILVGTTTPEGDFVYSEEGPYHMIDVYYPATTSLPQSVDHDARMIVEQALADRIAEFKLNGNFDALTAEDVKIQGLGPDRKYALAIEYDAYESPQHVSYVFSIYEDTLGAHPNGYYMTQVFDRAGTPLALGDLFVPESNYLERIATLAKAQVEAELESRLGEEPGEAFFEEGVAPTLENFQNFYLEGETLVLLFPPYQVASYAAGFFEARIPLADLAEVLK